MLVDELLRDARTNRRLVTELPGERFRCLLWKVELPDARSWLVAKPQTFMNLSGESVQPLSAWHKIQPNRILVIHDELDLPIGRMRFKIGGGNAGHNGLASITQRLATPDFYRLRLGIGRPPKEFGNTVGWVLGHFNSEEQSILDIILPEAVEVIHTFVLDGPVAATQAANSFRLPQ